MSCLLFGSVAGIHCVTTAFSPVQFLAYRWMYTADGVSCYATLLWRKENIRTNLRIQSGLPPKPKDLILLRHDRWVVQHFILQQYVQLFSAVSSLFVCCCARACEGSRCQHEILWLRWQCRQLPKPRDKVGGGRDHFSAAFSSTGLNDLVLDHWSFYCTMITWKPDQVSVVVFKKPQWHQSLLLLHQASFFAKPQTICLRHRSLKALFTGGRIPRWNLSSWATGILCLQYTSILMQPWATFPRIKSIEKLKQEQDKLPWTLVSTAFNMTSSENSRRWRV